MPLSKKRKKDEKKKRRERDERPASPGPAPELPPSGGLLSRMRGGIQNVAGTGPKKPASVVSKILTWALVAVALWFLARRFGIIP
jgi:hypothetical protein